MIAQSREPSSREPSSSEPSDYEKDCLAWNLPRPKTFGRQWHRVDPSVREPGPGAASEVQASEAE